MIMTAELGHYPNFHTHQNQLLMRYFGRYCGRNPGLDLGLKKN
jgi:hypothetical protein